MLPLTSRFEPTVNADPTVAMPVILTLPDPSIMNPSVPPAELLLSAMDERNQLYLRLNHH